MEHEKPPPTWLTLDIAFTLTYRFREFRELHKLVKLGLVSS